LGLDGILYGTSVTITDDVEIPVSYTLTVPEGKTLTIPKDRTLTVKGTVVNNGTIINCGTIIGTIGNNQPEDCDPGTYIITFHISDAVLYPNPFTDEIMVSNPSVVKSVQITNIVGQDVPIVFNGKSIATENLGSGVYFVILESYNGEKVVHKIIKK